MKSKIGLALVLVYLGFTVYMYYSTQRCFEQSAGEELAGFCVFGLVLPILPWDFGSSWLGYISAVALNAAIIYLLALLMTKLTVFLKRKYENK